MVHLHVFCFFFVPDKTTHWEHFYCFHFRPQFKILQKKKKKKKRSQQLSLNCGHVDTRKTKTQLQQWLCTSPADQMSIHLSNLVLFFALTNKNHIYIYMHLILAKFSLMGERTGGHRPIRMWFKVSKKRMKDVFFFLFCFILFFLHLWFCHKAPLKSTTPLVM